MSDTSRDCRKSHFQSRWQDFVTSIIVRRSIFAKSLALLHTIYAFANRKALADPK
jgi:hypothetical protein